MSESQGFLVHILVWVVFSFILTNNWLCSVIKVLYYKSLHYYKHCTDFPSSLNLQLCSVHNCSNLQGLNFLLKKENNFLVF